MDVGVLGFCGNGGNDICGVSVLWFIGFGIYDMWYYVLCSMCYCVCGMIWMWVWCVCVVLYFALFDSSMFIACWAAMPLNKIWCVC